MKKNKRLSVSKKPLAPQVEIEEQEEIILNGKKLIKGKDYKADSLGDIEFSEKVLNEIKKSKSCSFFRSYSYSRIEK